MSKTLIVVESPAKCKTIQKYLGEDYIVLACFGHCVDLAKNGKFGIGVDFSNNLQPKYVLMPEKRQVFDKIVEASEACDSILLAGDPDREGESICYHLSQRLASTGKTIKRIKFNQITQQAIKDAVANPMEIDLNLFYAQQSRRVLDRIVGFMVSPVLMKYFGQNLSAGRVQSVAVRVISDREKEIKTFVPKEYWNLVCDLTTSNNEKFKVKYDGSLTSKEELEKVVQDISASTFKVSSVLRKTKKEKPPAPLTTLMLQQAMARAHGFSAERTMAAAQNCYESGYISYIRTDSIRISDDAIKSIRSYLSSKSLPIPKKPNVFEAKESAADSHEAIRCTNVTNEPANVVLAGDEKTLYDMVWKYSVASQMQPAEFDTLEVKINNGNHIFKTSGKSLKSKGFLEIFGSKDYKIDVPNLTKGDLLSFDSAKDIGYEQKFTQPPSRYNEASLIKELDSKQIGRPSTMATILKNILSRKYVEKKGNVYYPTELGSKVTDILVKYFNFLDIYYSASMENKLDAIAAGKISYEETMKEFYSLFSKELEKILSDNSMESCEKCHGMMKTFKSAKDEEFLSCTGCRNYRKL